MRKFVDFMNIVISVMAGMFLCMLLLGPQVVEARVHSMGNSYLAVVCLLIGIAIIALNLILAGLEIRTGCYRRDLAVTTQGGTNVVSIAALEKQLLDELQTAEDVSDPCVTLEARGEGLPIDCRIAFKLQGQEDVMNRVDAIRESVRARFLRIIPSGVGIEISTEVKDLVKSPATSSESTPSSTLEREFSGPVYPITERELDSEADPTTAPATEADQG